LAKNQAKSVLEISGLGGSVMLVLMGFFNAKIVYRQPLRWLVREVRGREGRAPLVFLGYSLCPLHWQFGALNKGRGVTESNSFRVFCRCNPLRARSWR
jgi:hypothetical protein